MDTSQQVPDELRSPQWYPQSLQYFCALSPVPYSSFIPNVDKCHPVRLFFLSGLPTAEKPGAKRYFMMSYPPQSGAEFGSPKRGEAKNDIWANYKTYLSRTSIVIPIPPQLYRPLPEWFKRTVLLDFPFFRFDEEKDGNAAIEEARRQDA